MAQVILKVAEAKQLPPHILIGSHTCHFAKQVAEERLKEAERWAAVSAYADFTNYAPLPELPIN